MPQVIVIVLIALGEEYGWRGFLLPALMKKFNLFYSSIILGLIWGCWHFPAYLQAYNGLKEDSRDPDFRTRPVSVIRKDEWKLLMFHEEWSLDGGIKNLASNNAVELYNLKL